MAENFPAGTVSETDAIDRSDSLATQASTWVDNGGAAAGTHTITAAQMVNGTYRVTSGASSTLTTDTAANIIAQLAEVQVGSSFRFGLINGGSGTATLTGGTGVTIVGNAAPTTGKNQWFVGMVTDVTSGSLAVDLIAETSAYS